MQSIREQLADLQHGLGRIEGKFDGLMARIDENRVVDRLRAVENNQARYAGAAGVLGAVAGAMISVVVDAVVYHHW